MTRSVRFITIGLGLAVASGVVVWQAGRGRGDGHRAVVEENGSGLRAEGSGLTKNGAMPARPTAGFPQRGEEARAEAITPVSGSTARLTAAERRQFFDDPFVPTREELEWRAVMVEQESHHGLKNLIGVLNLSDDQQDRVFAALARNSEYYHPALQMHGSTGADLPVTNRRAPAEPADPAASTDSGTPAESDLAAADPVVDTLTPDQIEVYDRYTSEREAFWSGVVKEIEAELTASGP